MGLRIVDRLENEIRQKLELHRQNLLKAQAFKYCELKGWDSDAEEEFIHKIKDIHETASPVWAKELAENLEDQVKEQTLKAINFQGPLEPSVIMELL